MSGTLAVIFDMDGVLVDSYFAHQESWRRLAAEQGFEMSDEQFDATFGRTSREIIELLWGKGRLSNDEIARLDDRKEGYYREIIREDFPAMEGAAELIDALSGAGFRLAVGSSGPQENVELVLERLNRAALFDGTVSGDDVTIGKPNPQVFQIAAERVGTSPGRCVVVEDAPAGIEAAHAAEMKCIGVVSTGRSRNELAAADLVVERLAELSAETFRGLIAAT